ncbi:hypothetical protein [Erwinia sp. Leaf53]|uniref:ParB/RepB/Spo0J family partition protein n=1 Tax=Erwinia sp. Leaf53 TaxID=1736225 RepID=UPI0006FC3806|nr:hypothetical protein [Erwinia sp. Leaf53]KQN56746.1 hypothetical protein ASF13_06390 [Erwinia sp. Leaf53]
MTSLSVVHKNREESGTDIVPRKIWYAAVKEFYVEPGYNIREIDPEHVKEFRDAFIAGDEVPALLVQVTEKGLKIVDGHHRYYGALAAIEAGTDVPRLECKDAPKGSEADRIAIMVTSSQGRALLPLERAGAYQRLMNQGFTEAEIAKKVKRSVADVEQHLQLLECGDKLIGMVKANEVSATTAVSMSREFGTKAGAVAEQKLAEAKASGKKKLTKSAAMPQFSAVKSRRLAELLVDAEFDLSADGKKALVVREELADEINAILEEYRKGVKSDPVAPVTDDTLTEKALPLTKADIISESGLTVWACAAAAFGEKDEFSFSESRYAHTWAADSVEAPECLMVPAETIQKAINLISQAGDQLQIEEWVSAKLGDLPYRQTAIERITQVYEESRAEWTAVAEFLSLIERTGNHTWTNIRELRADVKRVMGEMVGEASA